MKEIFGYTNEGKPAYLVTLKNNNGMKVSISNYGGLVHSIHVPDKNGRFEDILLGFDDFSSYLDTQNPYFGCIVGRVANRIAGAEFTLNGQKYVLAKNADENHLHGGNYGFNRVLWEIAEVRTDDNPCVTMNYLSSDGEEGYPGNLNVNAKFELNGSNELTISFQAHTDQVTPVNLSHHAYFNLSGNCARNIMKHQVKINASSFTEINSNLIPTGKIVNLENTPLDFRTFKTIEQDFFLTEGGYDHNFVLDGKGFRLVAEVVDPESRRKMEVLTTSPGMQFYTGNFLGNVTIPGKMGKVYQKQDGFCFETQFFPNSPNIQHFPSIFLKPGEKYEQKTVLRFSVV